MIHEALFSLWNCGGDLFKTITEEEWLHNIELHDFLHPGERQLLQKIMDIAVSYHKIEEFRKTVATQQTIQYQVNPSNGSQENQVALSCKDIQPGLYIKAFCNGVDEVLETYRNEIISMEERFLHNPNLTLTFVLGCVEKYNTLFDVLKSMIRMIQTEKIHGALLLGRLHFYIDCNIPSIVQATDRIIKSVNTVFYRHLCNWIIYGDLVDRYNEFFIYDGNCPDENFEYQDKGEGHITSFEMTTPLRKSQSVPCSVRKFFIRPEMLPSIICRDTAETILFMGRIVWIVRNDPKKTLDDNYHLKFKRDIWEGNDTQYYQKIQKLENYPFNLASFERTIEDCRLKLTKYLWTIMVKEAKLLDHLQHVRDYYALGRGELFQHFIVSAGNQLKETPNSYIVKNLNFVFKETATKMYGEYDKSFQKFELAIVKHSEAGENPWTRLKLNFDIVWPLHIIFHPKTMELYNKLFRFLLTITRTHIELNKLWQMHMSTKKRIHQRVWTLRHNLMFLVNNLQYYLQVDVIEAEFSVLKKAVQNANEFEDIIRQHSKFMSRLLSKTFVMTLDETAQGDHKHSLYQVPTLNFTGKNTMYSIIYLLLELCNEFCLLAHTWDSDLNEPELKDLEDIETRANNLTDMLLRVLYNIHQKVSGPHLLQLLHRLDFNRWYSKSKPDFNLTVT